MEFSRYAFKWTQKKKLTLLEVSTVSLDAEVVSCKSAEFASPETVATMLMLSTTCCTVKAASALWENKKAEKTEPMTVEILMMVIARLTEEVVGCFNCGARTC